MAGGVNYFDCLSLLEYSESSDANEGYEKLGKTLEGLREKVYITYLSYVAKPLSYAKTDFECYLRALNTSHTDIFTLACCDKMVEFSDVSDQPRFDVIDDEGTYNSDILGNIWDKAYEYISTGKSGAQPRKSVYSACSQNGVGVIAMKPFAGGFVLGVEKSAGFTPINLIYYVLAQDGVSTVIPGCENPRHVADILAYYTAAGSERDYSKAIAKSRWSVNGNCLYCNHCLPCPANINIAHVNKLLNSFENENLPDAYIASAKYSELVKGASPCL